MSAIVAVLLAMAGTVGALFLPLYDVNITRTISGVNVTEQQWTKPVDTPARNSILIVASLCVALSITAAINKGLQPAMGICLLAISLLGAMSVGMFYLPSAAALLSPTIRRWYGQHLSAI